MTQQRRCDFVKAVDQQWYMTLGDHEHAYDDIDCTVYGPFPSCERAERYQVEHFRNPGGSMTDDRGQAPVPLHAVRPALEEDDLNEVVRATPDRPRRLGR